MIPRKKRLERHTALKAKKQDSLKRRNRMRHKRISAAERRERDACRMSVFQRSAGFCEAEGEDKSPKCKGWVSEQDGHLAHKRSRNLLTKDKWKPEHCLWKCDECHTGWEHNGRKPCPKKPEGSRRDYVPKGAEAGA